MRNYLKRIGALLLCLALLIPAGGVFATEDAAASSTLSRQLMVLNQLGLVDQALEDIDVNGPVTRVSFALTVARIYGVPVSENGDAPAVEFDDMEGYSNEEVHAVKLLADMGLVSGTGYRTFSPEETITQEQAAKILVSALGYSFVAQEEGGYPAGYVARASRLGLMEDFSFNGPAEMTWKEFIPMFYRSLFADIMQPLFFGDEMNYTVVKDENVLTNVMNLGRVRAQMVTATDETALGGGTAMNEGYVEIGGLTYYDNGEAAWYLGQLVDVYYKCQASGRRDIIHVALTYDQDAFSVKINKDLSINGFQISFFDGKANRTVKVAPNANMIYNGEAMLYDPSVIDTNGRGTIFLQHSGDSNGYDLIIVQQYTNVVVDSVNLMKNVIYDQIDTANPLDLDAMIENQKCLILRGTTEISIDEIQPDEVLTIYRTASGDRVTIEVNNSTVSGTFGKIGKDTVMIGSTNYPFDASLQADLQSHLGQNGLAYLTIDGEILLVEWEGTTGLQYGYLLRSKTDGTFDNTLTLRLLTAKGVIDNFKVANKIHLNGSPITSNSATAVINALQRGGAWQKQLIQYQLDEESKIVRLNTADETVAMPTGKHDEDFYCSFPKTASVTYRSVGTSFKGYFTITPETLLFFVDQNDSDDEELYQVKNSSEFRNGYTYTIAAFNMQSGGAVDVAVCWRDMTPSVVSYNTVMMIEDTSLCLNKDGENVECLTGLVDGNYVEYYTKEPIIEKSIGHALRRGDLVQFSTDTQGNITAIQLRVDRSKKLMDNPTFNGNPTNWRNSWGGYDVWGFASAFYDRSEGYALVSTSYPSTYLYDIFSKPNLKEEVFALQDAGVVMVYDETTDSIYKGTANDIVTYTAAKEDADRVFIQMQYTSIKNIYVYKFEDPTTR